MCPSEEDTTEHTFECNKGDKKLNLNDEIGKDWGELKLTERTREINQ